MPTFAVLVLLAISPAPFGANLLSAVLALSAFALPPLLTNTYVGVRQVGDGRHAQRGEVGGVALRQHVAHAGVLQPRPDYRVVSSPSMLTPLLKTIGPPFLA